MQVKKFLFVLSIFLCLSLAGNAVLAVVPVPIQVILDGSALTFDVPPQNNNGRILVPLRAIFEAMGAAIDYDGATQTVTATKGDVVVVLTVGDTSPTINGSVVPIDTPGMIFEGRTLAPLRFVAEAFGGAVVWDSAANTATITLLRKSDENTQATAATKLLYQGHGSIRITAADGTVIFIDPYIGEGYDKPADIVLVTHQHQDHNKLDLVKQNTGCRVITNVEALEGDKHNTFTVGNVIIEAVEAGNKNHNPNSCVGYLLTVDGFQIYAAGDTSKTAAMEGFAERRLDYALLPADGVFNMDLAEAADCAAIIGARNTIPIHLKPGELWDKEMADAFAAPNKLIVSAGEEITLAK